jgi:hypothetical protein
MKTPEKLSLLWMIIVANILLADVLSAFIAFGDSSVIDIPGNPRTVMAVSALLLNIPILMIYLSRVLKPKLNRRLNIVAALITLVFIIGGASNLPHYIIIATIETVLLVLIVKTAVKDSFES